MRIGIAITVLLCCMAAAPSVRGAEPVADFFPGVEWQRADPMSAGWSADRLNDAETWSRQIGTTALIVVHHGRIVAQWGDTAAKTPLASIRKSLLSALFGNGVERGDIDLKQTLAELGIDDNEPSLLPGGGAPECVSGPLPAAAPRNAERFSTDVTRVSGRSVCSAGGITLRRSAGFQWGHQGDSLRSRWQRLHRISSCGC